MEAAGATAELKRLAATAADERAASAAAGATAELQHPAAMEADDRATPAAAGAKAGQQRPAGWETWPRQEKKRWAQSEKRKQRRAGNGSAPVKRRGRRKPTEGAFSIACQTHKHTSVLWARLCTRAYSDVPAQFTLRYMKNSQKANSTKQGVAKAN